MAVAQLPPRWGTRTLPAVLRELLSDGASPVRGLHPPSTCQRRGTSYVVLGERRECPEPSAKPVSFPLFARGGFEASSTQRGSSRRELAVPGGDARTSGVGRAQGHCHGQGRGATAPPAPQSQPVTPQHQPVLRRTQPAPPRASLCSPEPSLCSPQRPACALPRAQPAPPPSTQPVPSPAPSLPWPGAISPGAARPHARPWALGARAACALAGSPLATAGGESLPAGRTPAFPPESRGEPPPGAASPRSRARPRLPDRRAPAGAAEQADEPPGAGRTRESEDFNKLAK